MSKSISLILVPGHCNIHCNELADALVKSGVELDGTWEVSWYPDNSLSWENLNQSSVAKSEDRHGIKQSKQHSASGPLPAHPLTGQKYSWDEFLWTAPSSPTWHHISIENFHPSVRTVILFYPSVSSFSSEHNQLVNFSRVKNIPFILDSSWWREPRGDGPIDVFLKRHHLDRRDVTIFFFPICIFFFLQHICTVIWKTTQLKKYIYITYLKTKCKTVMWSTW